MYGNEPSIFFNNMGAMDASIPAYICMIMAVTGIMGLPLTVALYRERKILKRFMVTPMSPMDILLSQIIANFGLTVVGVLLLITLGKIRYNVHFFGNLPLTILMFILIAMSTFSLGLLIAGVAKNAKAATALSYIVYFPMLFLSGAAMPLELFPDSIRNISKLIPLTYAVKLLRGVWLGGNISEFTLEIVVLLVVLIVATLISIKLFKWE